MSRLKYAAGIVLLVSALVAFSAVSISMALVANDSWEDYKQPYKPNLPPVPLLDGVAPLGNHVVIVVIDGARPDIVEEADTPNIDWIRENGTWFNNAQCFTPSISDPGYATIGTGAKPSITGVTSNLLELNGDIGIDNIFKIVSENETTAVAGSPGWMNLYGDWISVNKTIQGETLDMDEVIGEYAVSLIELYKPKLLLVHLYDTDHAGHEYGAASGEYKQQIEGADAEIGKILQTLNTSGILNETLLIIMSDHGMLDEGGHGGWEKDVLCILLTIRGPHVKHLEISEEVLQDQVAATVSFFLGYRLPTGLTGGILYDVFDIDEERKAIYQISLAEIKYKQFQWFAEQFNLKEQYEDTNSTLGQNVTSAKQLFGQGEYSEAFSSAGVIEDDCENLIRTVWEEKHSKEISSRLQMVSLIYVAALVPTIIIAFVLRRKIDWAIFSTVILGAIGYLVGFWTAFFASGWYFSFSVWASPEEYISGAISFIVAGLSVSGLAIGLTAKWTLNEKNRRVKIVLAALLGVVLVVIVNMMYVSSYWVKWNYVLDWYFPEGRAWGDFSSSIFMLAQNAFVSVLSAISPVVALITSKIVTKLSKKPKPQQLSI